MNKHIFCAVVFGLLTPHLATAEDQPVKKTFAEQMAESIEQQLAEEEAQRLAIEAAKPTEESIAAECDVRGDLAVKALALNKNGVALADAKAAIRDLPEGIGTLEPLGADMLVDVVYSYFSKSSPENLKSTIVSQCLIK